MKLILESTGEDIRLFDEARPAMGGRYRILHGVGKGKLFRVDAIDPKCEDTPRGRVKTLIKGGDIVAYRDLHPFVIGAKWVEDD